MDGKITICRDNHDTIRLCLTDSISCTEFLRLTMTAETLGLAITGLAWQPCTFELRPGHVGKMRETKTECVPFPLQYGKYDDNEAKHAALAPFEVDGWKGYPGDLGNHHRGDSKHGYNVTFTRFVDKKEDC